MHLVGACGIVIACVSFLTSVAYFLPEAPILEKLPSIEVGPTALAGPMTLTLTFSSLRAMVLTYTHIQNFKVNGQSVPKIERKETDGQTHGGDCITSLANALGNNN